MKKHAKKIITILLAVALLVPTVAMIFSSAAIADYPVELTFNNIFVFDHWSSNTLSTTIVSGGAPVSDKLELDLEAGSVTFTNNYSGKEAYTGHGMGQGAINSAGNFQYYMMDVEPGTTYTFSYNLSGLTQGIVFSPYVFFFDESGSYTSHVFESVGASGDVNFVFTTPTNAKYIQIRFTLSNAGSTTIKNIAIRKTTVSYSNSIFSFSDWANNPLSSAVSDNTAYNAGTVSKNTANNSVTLTTNSEAATKGVLFTGFTFGNGNDYYMMPVEAEALYSLQYNLASCNFATNYYSTYIVYYDANKNYTGFTNFAASTTGLNKFDFKIPAGTAYIQVMFGISGIVESGKTCTIKDTSIHKATFASDANTDLPHRVVYTYKADEPTTYGTLPVPSYVPNGYVFAGWYTGIDGTGELITENTLVKHSSCTVYAKYEPIVNSISIKTMPIKTEYTVGERVNPTGLVIEATVGNLTTTIESGYRCTPEYLTSVGTQLVTVHYGGKTATYSVNVSASASKSIVVNGSTVNVDVTNNLYTFAGTLNTGNFNRYAITYNADAYFEGIITYDDGVEEQFFLEPSSNFGAGETPKFTSFVDGYLEKVINGAGQTTEIKSHSFSGIKSIKFTPLDNKAGSIELLSLTTSKETAITSAPETIKSFSNDTFKVEVDILNGGVVSGLYVLNRDVVARVYEHKDPDGNKTYETKVDFKENLSNEGYISESTNVNLINIYDTGRYLQQSYYGTLEKPYEPGYYNQADWHYNPVQGGNVANEASKVLDYEIGDNYIYVKARPLDWARWSDEHAAECTHPTEDHTLPRWGDGYITDTYVEAKYVFEDGVIKTYCRMVDYSGLPSAQTSQELPAFYTIEPLNKFVYNDVSEDEAWVIQNFKYNESPEFWGITQDYINLHYSNGGFDPNVDVAENWAAFMASESTNSFGIGLYTPETTNFFYGCYPAIYSGKETRHATTIDPAIEDSCSYIAPIGIKNFESYNPSEYTYTLAIGTVDQIHDTFGMVDDKNYEAELNRATVAVPETIYMTPSAGQSTTGQYFVNNRLDKHGNLIADAVSNATTGIISVYAPGSTAIKFNVSAIKGGIGDPVIGGGSVETTYENQRWAHSLIHGAYGTGATQDWFEFNALQLLINGTGLSAGSTALLEWEVTIYYGDTDTVGEKHYAYTTLYSPWLHPVGAATRAQTGTNGNEIWDQSVAWISGVHGYTANSSGSYKVAATGQTINDEGEYSEKGTYYAKTSGNYIFMPMLNNIGTPDGTTTAVKDFLSTSAPNGGIDSPTIRFFSLTNSKGNYGSLVSDISPIANITVDTSRYTNFNEIPNLRVGYNITDVENSKGVIWYVSDLTDIVNAATDATTHEVKFYNYTKQDSSSNISNKAKNEWFTGKSTGVLIYGNDTDNRSVSNGVEYHAAWDRQIITGSSTYSYMFKGAAHAHYNSDSRAYSLNHVQVLASNVNKANLRDLVSLASSLNEENYTSASWTAFKTALQNASYELGNPTDADIAAAKTELTNKMMALQTPATLIANGGKFSNGATTATVNLTCGPSLAPHYTIAAENNPTYTGYSLDGWSTDKNATEGSNPVIGGLNPTFYAIWTEGSYVLVYNGNGGVGYIDDATYKYSDSVTLALTGYTRDGYSLVGWAKSATATSPDYLLGQTVTDLSNGTASTVTLYAVWLESRYTVIFNANGGTGSIANKTVDLAESFTLPSSGFTKEGCTLLGWATKASATAPEYQLGQTVSHLAAGGTITIFAVWRIDDPLAADVVILDFATPIVISPTNNDTALNGLAYSIVGISFDGEDYASTLEGEYGTFVLNDSRQITYTPSEVINGTEEIYYHVSVNSNGTNSTFTDTITVAPASNILYEETELTVSNTTGVEWGTVGEASSANQTSSTENDIYGYDSNTGGYNKISNYSNGSALAVTVDADNKRSHNLSFEFEGIGFDLNSACGYNTGVMIVSVKNLSTQKMVKSYIVDTYYSDLNNEGKSRYSDTLYQVPIINETALPHDNYLIQISASYLPSMSGALSTQALGEESNINAVASIDEDALRAALADIGMEYILDAEEVNVVWFDEDSVLNGGYGVNTIEEGMLETQAVTELLNVVDSIRVYNPITDGDLYYSASEKGAQYYNVIDNLVNTDGSFTAQSLFSYISGKDKETITVENYDSVGPKDELYLASGTEAVAFSIKDFDSSTSKIMISLRAASTFTDNPMVKVKIGSKDFDVTSNTEMYYDITDYVVDGTITIQNMTPGTLLSVGSVKITSTINQAVLLSSDLDLATASFMMMASSSTVEPNAPEAPAEPEDTTDPNVSTEHWIVGLIRWIIANLKKLFASANSVLVFKKGVR